VGNSNDEAYFVDTPGVGLQLLARTGGPIADLGSGALFTSFLNQPAINDSGRVAFLSWYSGSLGGGGQVLMHGTSPADLRVFLDSIQPVPGIGGVVSNAGVQSGSLKINSVGDLSFTMLLDGAGVNSSNYLAIYGGMDGAEPRLVARLDDQAPGYDPGVRLRTFLAAEFNDLSQTAFMATIGGNGISPGYGIFATDQNGVLQLVAAEGRSIDVNNDPLTEDRRTISKLGQGLSLNDVGQLSFYATFTDGSEGVFVASVGTAVPEPAASPLLGATICCLSIARRRARALATTSI
jgi:hypothetical protein